MGLTLSPYNMWIFLASIIVLLVFFVLFAKHGIALIKTIKARKPVLDEIEKNVTLAKIKKEAMAEKKQEDEAKNKYLKIAIPILLAIKHIYDEDDNLHGIKGYAAAANRYARREKDIKQIMQRLISSI